VERRRSAIAVAAAGLAAALGLLLIGSRSSSGDLRAAVADLDASIREAGAAVQARAETLAQLPRLGWAVATDEDTMRDLTTEELAFRTHAGEHIEITQVRRDGGQPRRLLHLPVDDDLALPLRAGTHLVVRAGHLHLVTIMSIEPRQRADELLGVLAVAKELDTAAFGARLGARGINAALRTSDGSVAIAGTAPSGSAIEETVPLTRPAGAGASIVAGNVRRTRWARAASPFVLVAALAAAAWLWRRGRAVSVVPTRRAARPSPSLPPRPSPQPSPLLSPPPAPPRHTTPASLEGAWEAGPNAVGAGHPPQPGGPSGAARRQRHLSGHVDVTLARSGPVAVSPVNPAATSWPIDPSASKAQPDPRTEEYRALFAEFVNMRRTTGEPVEGLNSERFIETLHATRTRIMKQIPVKDVRFKLAFQNGKAAIRYQTVT
jgi:hypothetical protein